MDRVKGLFPYRFRYMVGQETPTVGLMAQDVENVIPEAVHLDAAGRRYVNYDSIVAVLVGAVKELEGEISSLKSRL